MSGVQFWTIELLPFWSQVLSFIASLSWPVVALLLLKSFRRELGGLLHRVTGLQFAGAGLSFQQGSQAITSASTEADFERLEDFPGFERTEAIAALERELKVDLSTFKEQQPNLKVEDFLIRHLAQARLDAKFFSIHNMIYGSQIHLLKQLRLNGVLARTSVEDFFVSLVESDDFFKDVAFSRYIGFLDSQGLVKWSDEGLRITPTGNDYLLFLYRAQLPDIKPH